MARDNLLTYPNFNEIFKIHTDTSAFQSGAVIIQKDKPITFYSKKLTDAQQWYIITDKEPLIIIETLKYFRTILLGQKIRTYTDHKNLTCNNFNTNIVLIWRLIPEEYDTEGVEAPGTLAFAREKFHPIKINQTPEDDSRRRITQGGKEAGTQRRRRDQQQKTPQVLTGTWAQAKGSNGGQTDAGNGGRSRHTAQVSETSDRGW